MGITYEVICTRVCNRSQEEYTTYGLQVRADTHIIKRIEDISVNQKKVQELAEICNMQKVSLYHIEAVVEDWLD